MSASDRRKWNSKYRQTPELLAVRPPAVTVEQFALDAPGRTAVDLACGGGKNTLFLAQNGFRVDAIDISAVALEELEAKAAGMDVRLYERDLDTFTPEADCYDLAVMTNYLDRALIRRTANALKEGGVFIVETYMAHPENAKQNANPDFLLQEGELKRLFDDGFTLLSYSEFWNEPHERYRMRKQGIAVEKRVKDNI